MTSYTPGAHRLDLRLQVWRGGGRHAVAGRPLQVHDPDALDRRVRPEAGDAC